MVCVLLRSKTVWRSVMFAGLLAAVTSPCAAQPLPAYNADIAQTSISGISAGAYMAVQFGTAWSSIIKGVGAIAGGPYGCSEGSLAAALSTCVLGVPRRNLAELIARTNGWSGHGDIDDPANIAAQKIYLFHGYNDQVVARPVSDWLRDFYAHYLNANTTNLFYQTAIGAGHAQVTIAYGSKCADNGGEYINKCRYDQAGIILQHIYGALNPRNDGALTGRLLRFSQADFTAPDEPIDESLNALGFAYVPDACQKQNPCRVHIVLHGCLQSLGYVGNNFVKHAGYNEWADANNLIILYPETDTLPVTIQGITNPESCWDWWGFLDADPMEQPTYLLKSGKQIHAIKAMLDRLTSGAPVKQPAPAAPLQPAEPPLPAAPATVLAPDRSDTAIDLVWSAIPDVDRYDVFRAGPDDAAFSQIGTVSGLSYADAGLRPATLYRYEVRAWSASATAPFSPVASASTLPPPPPCDDPGNCPVR